MPGKKTTTTIGFRVTTEERALLTKVAHAARMDLAPYLKQIVLSHVAHLDVDPIATPVLDSIGTSLARALGAPLAEQEELAQRRHTTTLKNMQNIYNALNKMEARLAALTPPPSPRPRQF